jgi:hypothetical protein
VPWFIANPLQTLCLPFGRYFNVRYGSLAVIAATMKRVRFVPRADINHHLMVQFVGSVEIRLSAPCMARYSW